MPPPEPRSSTVSPGLRSASAVGLPQPRGLRLVLQIVVEMIDLPLHAVGVRDPELVLVGVTAVDAHLLGDGEPGGLDARQLGHDGLHRLDLDADMVDGAAGGASAMREG